MGQSGEPKQILVGQIASLFQPFRKQSIPKDKFMEQFYPSLHDALLRKNKFGFVINNSDENNSHLSNSIHNRSDCLQWVYDFGTQWIHNIYFEESKPIENFTFYHKNAVYCEYLNGFTMCPIDDVGALRDYHLALLKCHNCYEKAINDYKTKHDIYSWMINANIYYFYLACSRMFDDTVLVVNMDSNSNIHVNTVVTRKNAREPLWNPYCYKSGVEHQVKQSLEQYNAMIKREHTTKRRMWMEWNSMKTKRCCYAKCLRIDQRIKYCSGCRKISYCSRKCQKLDWKMHRGLCDAIYRQR